MEDCLGVLLIGAVIIIAIYSWGGVMAFFGIGAAIAGFYGIKHLLKLEKKRQAQVQRDAAAREQATREAEARQRQHEQRQRNLHGEIIDVRDGAVSCFVRMPKFIVDAERYLDQAEIDFRERAFSPYWQQIENALKSLGEVDRHAHQIDTRARHFQQLKGEYEGRIDAFPVIAADTGRVKQAAGLTQSRLDTLIRTSQTDYQFATIFEQRKTNEILIHGFGSLGEAIYGLQDQLRSSFDTLGDRLSDLERGFERRHDELMDSQRELTRSVEAVGTGVRDLNVAAKRAEQQRNEIAGAQSREATRQLAMLDNLQRGRKPLWHERGPRKC